jgi:hypothetical protein
VPVPYNIPIVNIEPFIDPVTEDSIEVVTILKAPAELTVNGAKVSVKQGIASTKFGQDIGRVSVSVSRKGEKVIDFITPEGITDKPYRTDRIIYCFSSEFFNFHKDIFGDLPPEFSTEYAK